MANSKRTRFGLVFEGPKVPSMGSAFLQEIDVIKADGCERDGKHFMIFTTSKPRRSTDVLDSIKAFNLANEEKMNLVAFEDGPEVAVFDRGQCFRTHPISKIIQNAISNEEAWSWSMLADSDKKKKRAINELESDLVETAIFPTAPKRMAIVRPVEVRIVPCVIGAWHSTYLCYSILMLHTPQTGNDADPSTSKGTKKTPHVKKTLSPSSHHPSKKMTDSVTQGIGRDVVVMLVKEIARSKDETIQAKNQTIDLLMNRKCQSCAAGAGGGN